MLPVSLSSETEYLSTQTQLFPRKGTLSTLSDIVFPTGDHKNISTPFPSTMNLLSSMEGVTLTWNDLSVNAKHKQKYFFTKMEHKIKIIKNVTGCVPAGSLVAFIGASGAGKSTLMEALAYQSSCGMTIDGDIRVNGRPIGSYMRMLSGFMHQKDIFINTLTVSEHLHFMAKMKLDRRTTHKEREGIIEQLLTMLGLKSCANMFIENTTGKEVLSGGERKRLSFATACLTDPAILFCDEPTTGLDSYSAQTIVRVMEDMCIRRGKTVICTIHQPCSEFYHMFQMIVLLAAGQIVFIGSPDDALEFFERHGYECPYDYNPSDFMVKVVAPIPGDELKSQQTVKRMCNEFAASEYGKQIELQVQAQAYIGEPFNDQLDATVKAHQSPFWIQKLFWLIHRSLLEVIRNPEVQQIRVLQHIGVAVLVGLCFSGTLENNQKGIQAIQGLLFMVVAEHTFQPMYGVLSIFPTTMPSFLRDYRNGLYTPLQFYISNIILTFPGVIIEPVVFTAIIYGLTDFTNSWGTLSMTAFIATLCIITATACGYFFSALFDSVPMAMAYLVPFDCTLMVTSGIFIKLSTLGPYLTWLKYISWIMYSNEALSILQWEKVNNITCEHKNFDLPCFRNGKEVLNVYSFSEENFWVDIYALIGLIITFHILGFISVYCRSRNGNQTSSSLKL